MVRIKLLLILSLVITVVFCQAQHDTISQADTTKKITPASRLNFFNYHSEFSSGRFSSFNYNLSKTGHYNFGKLRLNTNYADHLFLRLDYAPLITRDNYSFLKNPNFNYHYNPANPWGVRNVHESLIFGSIDYLLWKLFPDQ